MTDQSRPANDTAATGATLLLRDGQEPALLDGMTSACAMGGHTTCVEHNAGHPNTCTCPCHPHTLLDAGRRHGIGMFALTVLQGAGIPYDTARAIKVALEERLRQIGKGHTTDSDAGQYQAEELSAAAACFMVAGSGLEVHDVGIGGVCDDGWPWKAGDTREEHTRFRNVAIGVALGIAELEQMLRRGDNS